MRTYFFLNPVKLGLYSLSSIKSYLVQPAHSMEGQEHITEFVESLKETYREKQLVTEEQWPPVSGDKLLNLQLVEADKREGFRGSLPRNRADSEKIKRIPILYDNLFRVEQGKKPARKVLVEGNGGMGKTTLCTMLSEAWAGGKMLTQFNYTILLPLREELVSLSESLSGLLALFHTDENVISSVVTHLKKTRGKGVLIIADGWDELDEARRSKQSFLFKLLFGRVLPSASVLLTSRPSASASLHSVPSVDRLVEVVGFNEKNIKQYIESEFVKCPEKASGLIEQLDINPLIQNVCTVPLNCAIICYLWYTLDERLPSTHTELYTQIILNVIFRNIKKKFPDFPVGLSLRSFDSLPSQLEPYWWLTFKFAFEALSSNRLVFTEDELASIFPEGLGSSLCFGLLQSAHSLLPVGHSLSFHFLHLTFQEYLAALHLLTIPLEEQLEVVRTHGSSIRFAMVWRFFFSLGSKKQGNCMSRVSKKVVYFDEEVVDIFLSAISAQHISKLVLLKCHCALESANDHTSSKIAKQINGQFLNGYGLVSIANTPHDCVAVLHVLSHTSHCHSVRINLCGCGLSNKLLKKLTYLLSSASGELEVVRLTLDSNKLASKDVSDLFKRASVAFSSLEDLSLENNCIDSDGVNSLVTSLICMSCRSLAWLYLSDNPLGVTGILELERAVVADVLVNLTSLGLKNTLTGDTDINGALLTTILESTTSHCPRLEDLDLSRNKLGVPGACALGEALPLLSNVKELLLNGTMLDGEAIIAFTECVKSAIELVPVSNKLSQSDGSFSCSLVRLEVLSLSNNHIDDEGVAALIAHIPYLFPLQYIHLDGNPVCDRILERLDECLRTSLERRWTEEKARLANKRADNQAKRVKEIAEKEARRTAVLSEWERTCSQPQSTELLEEFLVMWDELLWKMYFWACPMEEHLESIPVAEAQIAITADHQTNSRDSSPSPPPQSTASDDDSEGWYSAEELVEQYHISLSPQTVPEPHTHPLTSPSPRPGDLSPAGESGSLCPTVESPIGLELHGPRKPEPVIPELSLHALTVELEHLTQPIKFGIYLKVPQSRLEVIEQNNPCDIDRQKIALFKYLTNNSVSLGMSWTRIADALKHIHGDLALSIKEKYCSTAHGGSNTEE